MDAIKLEQLLLDRRERQFWMKPVGDPSNPPAPGTSYRLPIIRIDFAKPPTAVQLDDILIVYAVGQSKILYVADCYVPLPEATEDEIQREGWRKRWRYSIRGRNYTQEYGERWSDFNLRPFDLLKQYNNDYPMDIQSLGALQHGQDKQRISSGFAHTILRRILEL